MMRAAVSLVRHGEVHNPSGVLYGRLAGFHLSEHGRRQAQETAEWLSASGPPDAVWSSPLERARETAAYIAEVAGLDVSIDDRLVESGNIFEGMPQAAKLSYGRPDHWRYLYNPWRPSWGEAYRAIADRMLDVVSDARKGHADGRVVLVSHQSPIWVLRRRLEGRTLSHDPRRRQCAHASVTTLTYDGEALSGIGYDQPAVGP